MSRPAFAPTQKERIAAIDVGSNSIHLSVYEVDELGKFKVLRSEKDQTRLGSALDDKQCLDADALSRVANVLRKMKEIADDHKAEIRAVGTFALREAKNGADFVSKLYKRTGVRVDIISGHEEARLVYLGVQNGLPAFKDKPTLVCDIGGGSMELLIGQWGEESFATSLKLGCVHLSKTYLRSDPYTDKELAELNRYVYSRLDPVVTELRKVGFAQAVGTSGTIKAVKSVALGLQRASPPQSLHGVVLTSEEIRLAKDALSKARTVKDRKLVPGLDSKRADVVLPGIIVLDAVSRVAGVESWTVSLSAIREGLVIDTLLRKYCWLEGEPNDVRWRGVRNFAKRLGIEEAHAWHISSIAVSVFDQLQTRHKLGPYWREYLRAAAYLHEAGLFLGHTAYHKHGYYLIRNSGIFGYSIRELELVSLIVRYHRKRLSRKEDEIYKEFDDLEQRGVDTCAAILRLAASLDRRREGRIQEIKMSEVGKKCFLELFLRGSQDISVELYELELEKKLIEKALDIPIEIGATHVSFTSK